MAATTDDEIESLRVSLSSLKSRSPDQQLKLFPREQIEKWPLLTGEDVVVLMQHVRSMWCNCDETWSELPCIDDGWEGIQRRFVRYELWTAGCASNEYIIDALRANSRFWLTSWVQSKRGGYHSFEVELGGEHG
jgi:hypothetical protein